MIDTKMNWNDLKYFLAVARSGTTHSAAKELKASQPTVGRRIRHLEETLNTALFDRHQAGHDLTQRGEELLRDAISMESIALKIERQQNIANTKVQSIRLCVDEWTGAFLSMTLPSLQNQNHELRYELFVTHMFANLSRREADIAIWDTLPVQPNLVTRRLGTAAYAIYGSPSYVRANPASKTHRRYQSCHWLTMDDEHSSFHSARWLEERTAPDMVSARTSNLVFLAELARSGMGLAILPLFYGEKRKDLVRVSGPINDLAAPLWLIVHPDMRQRASVRAAMDILVDHFKHNRTMLIQTH